MDELIVSKSRLQGKVALSGAKNSALKLLAASLLTSEDVYLENYPSTLLDCSIHVGMLEKLGKECFLLDDTRIIIREKTQPLSTLKWYERSIRNTLLILGILTARTGEGAVPLPGGCKLGDRAFDLHEYVLTQLGAKVWQEGDMLKASIVGESLKGADIHLRIRSTGATENAILCGCLAKGVTTIWNPHIRPEILDLIDMLVKMGASISVYGQEKIVVEGVESLGGVKHYVIPDNMEAITWFCASVMTGGDLEIEGFPFADLEVPLIHLRESGAVFYRNDTNLIVRGGQCFPLEISTGPYPGINSDVQPILAAYSSIANGESRIVDLRFPGRYAYAEEMKKMGVSFEIDGNMLKIFGKGKCLKGAEVRARDLRTGIALVLCALVSEGETKISDAWQVLRGYDRFLEKINYLGGKVSER